MDGGREKQAQLDSCDVTMTTEQIKLTFVTHMCNNNDSSRMELLFVSILFLVEIRELKIASKFLTRKFIVFFFLNHTFKE